MPKNTQLRRAKHNREIPLASISYPRIHIQSARGVTLMSGHLVDKNNQTFEALVRTEDKKLVKINLGHYTAHVAPGHFSNTIYYRRIPPTKGQVQSC